MPDSAADACDRFVSTVFEAVLDGHPALASIEEIVREVAHDPACFGDRDAVNNTIRDLVKEGLLHRTGDFVFVTRAAIRTRELCI